jgi:hypothetical protein
MSTRMPFISWPSGFVLVPVREARTSLFTAADRTATHRRFWQWHPLRNNRRLRVSGGLNTNTRSLPNSIPQGRRSANTKEEIARYIAETFRGLEKILGAVH